MEMKTIEMHAREKWGWDAEEKRGKEPPLTGEWLLNAMRVHFGWAAGVAMTREDFDQAAETVRNLPISR